MDVPIRLYNVLLLIVQQDEPMSAVTERLPLRSEVPVADTWDLATLFVSDAAWEQEFAAWEATAPGYEKFRGTLGNGAPALLAALKFDSEVERRGDRIGTYAFLRFTEDVSNSAYQGMKARYIGVAAKAAEASSFMRPELLALPDDSIKGYLAAPELAEFKL